uniref:OmpR/PhoB-type domain-containing protein n=1 Tax=Ectopseudomonas oleovorans TaxID=301 RepID=A0A653AXD2_ECTOL
MPPATASPGSMPAPTITWSSHSMWPNSRRACGLVAASFQRPALEYRGVRLDPASQMVEYQGQTVNLPRKEFLLLHELLIQPGRVLTRDKLQQALYGWDEWKATPWKCTCTTCARSSSRS